MANGPPNPVARAIAVAVAFGDLATIVAAAGGAITWARFHQAALPSDQAVAATPNADC